MQNQQIPVPEKWTILSLLRWTAAYFDSYQIDSPRATAEILLAFMLHLDRIDLYLRYDQPLTESELGCFKALVLRRVRHEPVAYITGNKEFWSLDFDLDDSVLIPRPETECLVESVLGIMDRGGRDCGLRVLDLGTGSGAISIALAHQRRGHLYYAADIVPKTAAKARGNALKLGLESNIAFVVANWLDAFSQQARFDIIVSNPPYIRTADIPQLQPEIRDYEPITALDGGRDGLECIRHLIWNAGRFLEPGGTLLLEIGYDQKKDVVSIVGQNDWSAKLDFGKDYSGIDRIARLEKKI